MSKNKKEINYKQREEGFDLNSINNIKLNEYNALYDTNMRHYFENPNVQRLLYQTGQIDRHGRVINLIKNKSKLQILEREFNEAEKIEEKKLKEESDMRVSLFLLLLSLFPSLLLYLMLYFLLSLFLSLFPSLLLYFLLYFSLSLLL